jgi:CbiX
MWVARLVTTLVLTAHGSADPRSAANARAVARQVAHMRPGLDVRLAFCELNAPNLVDVLSGLSGTRGAVVTPLLLANAYHARIDIPRQIASCATRQRVWQAPVLGEDDRLVSVLRQRVAELGVSRLDDTLGVLVVAIGSSKPSAGCAVKAHAGWLSRRGSWRPADCRIGCADSRTGPASRWQLRWARTGWWPRLCWIASSRQWRPTPSRPSVHLNHLRHSSFKDLNDAPIGVKGWFLGGC